MKIILIIALTLLSSSLWAQAGALGIGAMLGNPTGLNGKYWLDNDHAVDGGLAFSLGKHSDVSLHSDYLFHKEEAFFFNDVHPLDFYYGIGGRMEFSDEVELGVRLPLGLLHKIDDKKIDVFGEIAPILDFVGRQGLEMHFAVGARYYL